MHRLSARSLVMVVATAGVVGWLGWVWLDRLGSTPVRVPWTTGAVCLVAAAVALWFGWLVRQYRAGKRPSLDAFTAARTVFFAQASAYVGALLAGSLGGYALALARDWEHAPRRELAIVAGLCALCALVLLAAGWVAERWCRIDPPTGDGVPTSGGTLAT